MSTLESSTRFRRALDRYDPYGFMQVNAAQALFVVICLFLINFAFSPPNFEKLIGLPMWGFLAIGREHNFDKRIHKMALFCIICVFYSILIAFFQNYLIVVLIVGVIIGLLFALSKSKYPFILPMISLIQAATFSSLAPPLNEETLHILRVLFNYAVLISITCMLMYCFPRIYFFRVFVRALSLSIKELAERIQYTVIGIPSDKLNFTHLVAVQKEVLVSGYKKNGFAARKITLHLLEIYTFLIAVMNKVETVEDEELLCMAQCCYLMYSVMEEDKILLDIPSLQTEHSSLKIAYSHLTRIISIWNTLCLKE